MSGLEKKRYGVTVNVYLDGSGYGTHDVCLSCENTTDTQYKCPFAMGEIMPMEEGMGCFCKDGCDCHKLSAQLDALKKAKNMVAAKIREIQAQMEE